MKQNPIFIHSLFRTGSTYLWNKFRQNQRYYCYYEPFHQTLATLSIEHPFVWPHNLEATDMLRHPQLRDNYLFEYLKLLRPGLKGIPFFKKSFIFDEFCRNEANPDVKRYIDFLVMNAGDKIAVFQFNRSALRVKWFKENYADSQNIYLVRNPHDQWESYVSMHTENEVDIFLVMDLLLAGVNRNTKCFNSLNNIIPLIDFHSDRFDDEEVIFRQVLKAYSDEERFSIFYYIWFRSLIENVLHTDFFINIDLLCSDSSYKEDIYKLFGNRNIKRIDLDDARIGSYSEYSLESEVMKKIEEEVQAAILKSFHNEEIARFFSRMSAKDSEFFNFDRNKFYKRRVLNIKKTNINKKLVNKQKKVIQILADYSVSQNYQITENNQKIKQVDNELAQKELQLNQKDQQIVKQQHQLGQKDQQLIQKEQLIAEKDQHLNQKDQQLVEQQHKLGQKDQQLIQKEQLIAEKNQHLNQKDQQLMEQQHQLSQKDQQLIQKEQLIAEKDQHLNQKNQPPNMSVGKWTPR